MGILKTFFLLIVILSFSSTAIHADDELILFHSDTCPHCIEVLDFVEKENLKEKTNLKDIESSEEGFREKYNKALEVCEVGHAGGYPTLYYQEECIFGKTNSIEKLSKIANIEESIRGETEKVEQHEPEEYVEQEELYEDEQNLPVEEEKPQDIGRETFPLWIKITMFIGPAIFLYVIYLIIKKLNI